jgi:hypothetical protein
MFQVKRTVWWVNGICLLFGGGFFRCSEVLSTGVSGKVTKVAPPGRNAAKLALKRLHKIYFASSTT